MCPIFSFLFLFLFFPFPITISYKMFETEKSSISVNPCRSAIFGQMVKRQPLPAAPPHVFGADGKPWELGRRASFLLSQFWVWNETGPRARKGDGAMKRRSGCIPWSRGKGMVTRGAGAEQQRDQGFSGRGWAPGCLRPRGCAQAKPQVPSQGGAGPGWPEQLHRNPGGVNLATSTASQV